MNKNQSEKLNDHFSIFVYPFEHGLPPKRRDHFLAEAWKAGWRPWICRLSGGQELLTLPNRLKGWFHPPTLEALYPEIHRLAHCREFYRHICAHCSDNGPCHKRPDPEFQQILAHTLYRKAKEPNDARECSEWLWAGLKPEDTLRLTYMFKNEQEKMWEFRFPTGQNEQRIAFTIDWVDAYLFPFQVGFLCFKIRLPDEAEGGLDETRLQRFMEFHQRFRDVNTDGMIHACGSQGHESSVSKEQFLRKWLDPMETDITRRFTKGMEFRLGDYIYRYKLFSFAALQDDDWLDDFVDQDGYYQGIDRLDALLYEMATTSSLFTLKNNDLMNIKWHPSMKYLKDELLQRNRISLWRFWRGMALKDTAIFLSIEGKEQPPAVQYENNYFPLYIYVLNLKMQLFQFANQLNLRRLRGNDRRIARVLDDFLLFRNEFWFSEISPNFQMEILYTKFKEGLEIEVDYKGVSTEVNDVFQSQESRFDRRLNWKVMILTVGAMIVGFFGMNSIMESTRPEPLMDLWDSRSMLFHLLMLVLAGGGLAGLFIAAYLGCRSLWRKLRSFH